MLGSRGKGHDVRQAFDGARRVRPVEARPAELATLAGTPGPQDRAAAQAEGKTGFKLTLHFPSYLPVMQYGRNRALRERLYTAYVTRASELGDPRVAGFAEHPRGKDIRGRRVLQRLDLARALANAGSTVVQDPQSATAILQILDNSGKRRVLSVRSTGKVQEYELYQTFEFRVRDAAGTELLAAQQLELTREYLFDADDVLSKSTEEEALRRDMRRDLVRLALLRLESLSR